MIDRASDVLGFQFGIDVRDRSREELLRVVGSQNRAPDAPWSEYFTQQGISNLSSGFLEYGNSPTPPTEQTNDRQKVLVTGLGVLPAIDRVKL